MNSLLVAYLPVIYFVAGFVPLLILGRGYRAAFPRRAPSRREGYAAIATLLVCGFVTVLSIPPGLKVLAGLFAGVMVGLTLPGREEISDRSTRSNWGPGVRLLLVCLILGGGLFLRVVNLDSYGVRIDEARHVKTAVGFLKTGEYRQWDFVARAAGDAYSRAFLFTRMVAFGFNWFGLSLASVRAVSVLWGMLLFLPAWFLGRTLKLRRFEFFVFLFWIAFSPYLVAISRWVRFYGAFTVFILTALLCCYWYLHHSEAVKAYLIGSLGLVSFLFALHLQLIGLLPILGVIAYLLVTLLGSDDSTIVPPDRLMVGGIVLLIVLSLISSFSGGSFFYLSDSGSAWGELTETVAFRPLYITYLFREPFGYLLGGVLAAGLFLDWTDRDAERYFFWVLVVPACCYLFFARRIPQFRFVGYLYPISFALLVLVLRRMIDGLIRNNRLLFYLTTGFLALVVPLGLIANDLPKVVAGQMGTVGFPGAPSPDYRKWSEELPRIVKRSDFLVVYNVPDLYVGRLRETGAELYWVPRSRRPQPSLDVERLRRARERGRDVWVVTLRNFSGLDTVAANYLRENFRVIQPRRWRNIRVYYSEGASP